MDFALLSYLYRYFIGTNSHLYFFLGYRFMRFGFGSLPPSPRMRDFSEWSQCLVMEQLLRYKPSSEDEVLDLLVRERERERGRGEGERERHTRTLWSSYRQGGREGGGWVGGRQRTGYYYFCLAERAGRASEARQQCGGAGSHPPLPAPDGRHAPAAGGGLSENTQ